MTSVAEQIAEATWQRLEQARRFDVRLGKETLTDILVLEWARSNAPYYRLFQTTKANEAIRGTDLEMYIRVGRSTAIVAAIQAKKLNRSGRYGGLNARAGNTAHRQIDILERYARQIQALPLYLLYNNVQTRNPAAYWHCCSAVDERQLGCTLVPSSRIREVLNRPRGRRNFDWLHSLPDAKPWRCLFECPRALNPSARGPEGTEARAHRLRMLAESPFARKGAWPDWLWQREGDALISQDELAELHQDQRQGQVRQSDSAPPSAAEEVSRLFTEPPRLIPRRVLLVDELERAD